MIKPFNDILRMLIFYAIFNIINILIQNLYSYQSNQLSMTLGYKINYLIMEKCGNLSLEKLEMSETYNTLSKLINEVVYKPYQAAIAIITIFINIISLTPIAIIIFNWNIWIFFLLLISSLVMFKHNLKIASEEFNIRQERNQNERKAWYYTYLLTHDTAFKEVKMLNLKDYFLNKYEKLVHLFTKQESKINKTKMLFTLLTSIYQNIILLVITFLSIKHVYDGKILIGTAITYISSITLFQSSITELASNMYIIYNCNLFMYILRDFLNSKESKTSGKVMITNIDNIKIENLYFNYISKGDILKDISFEVNKGETVAILGKNGSGKTTLLKLLCSLYTPKKGTIKINGINIEQINMTSYKRQISVLFQDFLRFEGTLLENVYIGNIDEKVNMSKICNALKSANVDFQLRNNRYDLNKNLDSWFDNGSQLSGGQWQKIALARVYYKKASLYLLD